jgi:hypothetical protein
MCENDSNKQKSQGACVRLNAFTAKGLKQLQTVTYSGAENVIRTERMRQL